MEITRFILTSMKKAEMEKLLAQKEVREWLNGITLKESTKQQYTVSLGRFLGSEKAADLIKEMEENPREKGREIKTRLAENWRKSPMSAFLQKNAILSFLQYFEVENSLRDHKVKVTRRFKKHELSWKQAEEIAASCREPYRSVFRFMVRTGAGLDEVEEIQNSTEKQQQIESQRSQPFTRIDLRPRKSNSDTYFLICPTEFVPRFPCHTTTKQNRKTSKTNIHDMQNNFRRAATRAGHYQIGLGAHHMRTAFTTTAMKAGVYSPAIQFALGHNTDQLGYGRPDTEMQLNHLQGLWKYVAGGNGEALQKTRTEVDQLKEQLAKQNEKIEALTDLMQHPEKWREGRTISKEEAEKKIKERKDRLSTTPAENTIPAGRKRKK